MNYFAPEFTISSAYGMALASMGGMTLQELAMQSGTRLVLPGRHAGGQIARVIAGDRMSDLLERAGPDALLVTSLANPHLFRMAELMDVPGICLVQHPEPGPGLLEAACSCGSALLLAGGGLEETRAALERCLAHGAGPGAKP